MKVTIDDQVYTIPPSSFIERKNLKCYFKVIPHHASDGFASRNFWVLGLTFLENYNSFFDVDE